MSPHVEMVVPSSHSSEDKAASQLSEGVEQADTCAPTMVLYARGTLEPGDYGSSIGPNIKKEVENRKLGWSVRAISSKDGYDAALSNNFCVGLPGGKVCRDVLQRIGQSCPTSTFVLAGYSQGAMVARICAAYVTPDIQQRIKVCMNRFRWSNDTNKERL
jgi:cutinase